MHWPSSSAPRPHRFAQCFGAAANLGVQPSSRFALVVSMIVGWLMPALTHSATGGRCGNRGSAAHRTGGRLDRRGRNRDRDEAHLTNQIGAREHAITV